MIINRTRTRMPVCLCLGHSDQKDVNVQGKTCDIDAGQSHGCAHLRGPIATKLCEDVHDYHDCPGNHAPNYVSSRPRSNSSRYLYTQCTMTSQTIVSTKLEKSLVY